MKKLTTVLAMVTLMWGSHAFAQTAAASTQPDTATLNFVAQATVGGLKEVKSGQLAQQKGQSAAVKSYGARMTADHTKSNIMLMQIGIQCANAFA
jgi:predicted outer membrane protein